MASSPANPSSDHFSAEASAMKADSESQISPPSELRSPKIKHDWYQTDSNVVVSILLKPLNVRGVDVLIEESSVEFFAETDEDVGGRRLLLGLDLAHPIVPSRSSWKQSQSKVEIKLIKSTGGFWKTLEKTRISSSGCPAAATDALSVVSSAPKLDYPSSNIHHRDWDKIVVDIDRMEEEEAKVMTGEASVNKLFQDIYTGGSDEVRRAMNKSFMESGGTVLSTNWNEVQKSEVEVKPPEGLEFKKWDQ